MTSKGMVSVLLLILVTFILSIFIVFSSVKKQSSPDTDSQTSATIESVQQTKVKFYQQLSDYPCTTENDDLIEDNDGGKLCKVNFISCEGQGQGPSKSLIFPLSLHMSTGGGSGGSTISFINDKDQMVVFETGASGIDTNHSTSLEEMKEQLADKESIYSSGYFAILRSDETIKSTKITKFGNNRVLVLSLDQSGKNLQRYVLLDPTGKWKTMIDIFDNSRDIKGLQKQTEDIIESIYFMPGIYDKNCYKYTPTP